MTYRNLFNEQHINQLNYNEIKRKELSPEQQLEFNKMLSSLNDFIEAADKIEPQNQQQAFEACISLICKKLYNSNK